jgi:hypothetical protein
MVRGQRQLSLAKAKDELGYSRTTPLATRHRLQTASSQVYNITPNVSACARAVNFVMIKLLCNS